MTEPNGVDRSRRRAWYAWAAYDWAASAYSTLLITFVLLYLSKVVLPGPAGDAAYGYVIGLSVLIAAALSPVVGAMADARGAKRWWLAGFAGAGALSCVVMALAPTSQPVVVLVAFGVANACYELSYGPYNGFLPEIADESESDRVSALGFAAGYLGGGLALLAALALTWVGPAVGLDGPAQLRGGLLLMAGWWGGFSLPAILGLRDAAPAGPGVAPRGSFLADVGNGLSRIARTLKEVRRFPMLAWFVVGYLFYNDGVQTVISQASVFAKGELKFETRELILLVLLVQLVGLPGAILVGRLAERFGRKRVLYVCLGLWVALLVAALVIQTKGQFWAMAVVLALILGGTQSVSRAMMSAMTPVSRSAEFFGFFNLTGKAASWMGPPFFAFVLQQTGSPRWAVFSLLPLFLIGWACTLPLDLARGRRDALAAEDRAGSG